MPYAAISFSEKFAKFSEHWSPKNIAQMNDYHFKLVKIQGDFVWHSHAATDEVFIVVEGEMTIQLRDGEVVLRSGEMFVVRAPRVQDHAGGVGRHHQYRSGAERTHCKGRGVGLRQMTTTARPDEALRLTRPAMSGSGAA